MSLNFVVNYAYQKLGAAALPENERWGFGKMHINTDIEPTTDEELKEVARTIGLEQGYEMVAIQEIRPLAEKDIVIDTEKDVLEGVILDDSE